MKKDVAEIITTTGKQKVDGYAVRFEGLDHDFIVHREYLSDDDVWRIAFQDRWVVTHKESGFKLPFKETVFSRAQAIKMAKEMLSKISVDNFNKSVQIAIESTNGK